MFFFASSLEKFSSKKALPTKRCLIMRVDKYVYPFTLIDRPSVFIYLPKLGQGPFFMSLSIDVVKVKRRNKT